MFEELYRASPVAQVDMKEVPRHCHVVVRYILCFQLKAYKRVMSVLLTGHCWPCIHITMEFSFQKGGVCNINISVHFHRR